MVLLFVVVLIVAWVWLTYNSLVRLKNSVEGAWAQIDVELKRRYDLIPNLVETVKGYAAHEKEVLQRVTEARTRAMGATDQTKRIEAEGELEGALGRLFAVAEAYPELKANENFLNMQNQLQETENRIERTRKSYNASTMAYHAGIRQFPRNIIAGVFNYKEQPYFTAKEEEKENIKVKF